MYKIYFFPLILMPILFLHTPSAGAAEVEFFNGNFRDAQQKAVREGKLLLIDFMADWCAPCKAMDQFTFPNPQVAGYLNAHYVAFRANIEAFDGYELKQQFQVKVLPTLVVMNTAGSIVGRHEESMTPARMLEVLRTYDIPANRWTPAKTPPSPGSAKANPPVHVVAKAPPVRMPSPVTRPAVVAHTPSVVKSASRENGLPCPLTSPNQKGFCVQTGTFGKYANALSEVKKLQSAFPGQQVMVHIGTLQGATAYKVLVGHCQTRQEATTLQLKLRNKGMPCFIQDLSVLTKS